MKSYLIAFLICLPFSCGLNDVLSGTQAAVPVKVGVAGVSGTGDRTGISVKDELAGEIKFVDGYKQGVWISTVRDGGERKFSEFQYSPQ